VVIQVRMARPATFEETVRVATAVDDALFGARLTAQRHSRGASGQLEGRQGGGNGVVKLPINLSAVGTSELGGGSGHRGGKCHPWKKRRHWKECPNQTWGW